MILLIFKHFKHLIELTKRWIKKLLFHWWGNHLLFLLRFPHPALKGSPHDILQADFYAPGPTSRQDNEMGGTKPTKSTMTSWQQSQNGRWLISDVLPITRTLHVVVITTQNKRVGFLTLDVVELFPAWNLNHESFHHPLTILVEELHKLRSQRSRTAIFKTQWPPPMEFRRSTQWLISSCATTTSISLSPPPV